MKLLPAVLAASCIICYAATTQAQSPTTALPLIDRGPAAAMSLESTGAINLTSARGFFGRVAARTNQAVAAQLQFPVDLAGQRVLVQSLDGAQLIGTTDKLTLGADGTATIRVGLGAAEGLYRIGVVCGDSRALVRFYAVAPGRPNPDPTLLIPSSTP
ncbi:MAG: hypothetical protein DLM52_11020 [Chthoniobacterales bacterium]|nr:MAG: hypothetical protein DLM52_11020 [Chthoniobacterales bacterium]